MSRKLALKRLTKSDLTFFQWRFENFSAGNQKSINLNSNIFVRELYPGLSGISSETFPMTMSIYGPGIAGVYRLQRKIVRSEHSKNWRLNGETIPKLEETTRFNVLDEGDFAIFDFNEGLKPESVTIVFIALGDAEDRDIHQVLDRHLGTDSMIAMTPSGLSDVIDTVTSNWEHPIHRVTVDVNTPDAELENVALGGSHKPRVRGTRVVPTTRMISREDLLKVKENADRTGRLGEQLINDYLSRLLMDGSIREFKWVSEENSVSPYDFTLDDGTSKVLIDVKTTQGEFERELHISYNELLQMSSSIERYDIYRVHMITEVSAQLRVARNMKSFAESVLSILNTLPTGITADSISISPSRLSFDPGITLTMSEFSEE